MDVYSAGEERVDIASSLVHASIMSEGVSSTSEDLLSVVPISQVLGTQWVYYATTDV